MDERKNSVYGAIVLIFLLILALGAMSNYAGMRDAIVFGAKYRWDFAIRFFSFICGLIVGLLFIIFASAAIKRLVEKRRNTPPRCFYHFKDRKGHRRKVYV